MKVAAISGAVIAALAATAVATPSVAQSYGYARDSGCRSDGTAGTVIGGIAGALLGSNLAAHHGGRAGGAAIGGVAGALIGNSVARNSCGSRGYGSRYGSTSYSNGYYSQPGYGYTQPTYRYAQPSYQSYGYAQPNYGAYGGYDNNSYGRYSDNSYGGYRGGDDRRGRHHHHDHDSDWNDGWDGD